MEQVIEQQVMRKIFWRLTPLMMLLYIVAFIYRVNVGFATLTMNKDVGLNAYTSAWELAFFSWLLPIRGTRQPDSRQGRCPPVDRPHTFFLGRHRLWNGVGQGIDYRAGNASQFELSFAQTGSLLENCSDLGTSSERVEIDVLMLEKHVTDH